MEIMRVVRMGTDIDTVNYDGQTVLHIMSKCGFIKVAALLAEGVDVSIRDRWGRTALQVAVALLVHIQGTFSNIQGTFGKHSGNAHPADDNAFLPSFFHPFLPSFLRSLSNSFNSVRFM
jgi:hypothetical protein